MGGQTLKSTYETYLRFIPINDIPSTCRDAIRITHELGYRYLWIDAFCIIQDDDFDKSSELVKMGDIYRYALLTIYAKGSPNSASGLFRKQDDHSSDQVQIPSPQVEVFDGPDYLEQRGWVLQETVLTSRRLAFGHGISWKCTMARATKIRPTPQARPDVLTDGFASDIDKLRSWLFAPLLMQKTSRQSQSRWNQFDSWYAIVDIYSVTSLTYDFDNLPALSGLARLFQEAHGTTYAAGLWVEDMQVGLSWYLASNGEQEISQPKDRVPSWSWVAVGKTRVKHRSWPSKSVQVFPDGAQCLGAVCVPEDPLNPYGAIKRGRLRLRARLKRARLRYEIGNSHGQLGSNYGSHFDYSLFGNTDARESPRYLGLIIDASAAQLVGEAALDVPVTSLQGPNDGMGMSQNGRMSAPYHQDLFVWCALVHVQKEGARQYLTALVLEPESNVMSSYRRLGLLFVADSSWFEHDYDTPTGTDQETAKSTLWKVIEIM